MNVLALPAAALAWVGRKGTLVVAASVFVGLAVPGLAAACKPYLGEAIVVMLALAFSARRSGRTAAPFHPAQADRRRHGVGDAGGACGLGTLFLGVGLDKGMPGLFFILVLQMSAPGLMSSPALAALMGLDVALTLASLVVCTAITPLTASLFSHVFLGGALVSPYAFGLKLFAIIAGSALAAAVIRRIAGRAWVEAQRERIDGLSVLAMFMFAVAAMDGVADHFRADPLLVLKLIALAFALAARADRNHRADIPARWPRPRAGDRPDRRKPQYRPDDGGDRLPGAGLGLALFRAGAVSDLSIAASAEAAGEAAAAEPLEITRPPTKWGAPRSAIALATGSIARADWLCSDRSRRCPRLPELSVDGAGVVISTVLPSA